MSGWLQPTLDALTLGLFAYLLHRWASLNNLRSPKTSWPSRGHQLSPVLHPGWSGSSASHHWHQGSRITKVHGLKAMATFASPEAGRVTIVFLPAQTSPWPGPRFCLLRWALHLKGCLHMCVILEMCVGTNTNRSDAKDGWVLGRELGTQERGSSKGMCLESWADWARSPTR